jgi:hypothetical protein
MDGFIAERERQSPAPRPRGTPGRRAAPATAFDRWLRQELMRLYGAALDEPVPDDLLRLIAEASPGGSD